MQDGQAPSFPPSFAAGAAALSVKDEVSTAQRKNDQLREPKDQSQSSRRIKRHCLLSHRGTMSLI